MAETTKADRDHVRGDGPRGSILACLVADADRLAALEDCAHRSTLDPGVIPRVIWCRDCGAIHVRGEWMRPDL
ncbi:MAG: hypothetical protein GY838_13135 [bacterium]|nr:hypothetical protein [bacterium]